MFCAGLLTYHVWTRAARRHAQAVVNASAAALGSAERQASTQSASAGTSSAPAREVKEVPPGDLKMVLIVRQDLKMQAGKTAAQCGHATLGAYKKSLRLRPEYVEAWETRAQVRRPLVVLCHESVTVSITETLLWCLQRLG
jgi:hypothetical protein